MIHVQGPGEPKGAGEAGREPNGDCCPQVSPGVEDIVCMPEEETKVADAEKDLGEVEGLVEALADDWEGE